MGEVASPPRFFLWWSFPIYQARDPIFSPIYLSQESGEKTSIKWNANTLSSTLFLYNDKYYVILVSSWKCIIKPLQKKKIWDYF